MTASTYIYTFACHENERELCHLELSTLLHPDSETRMDNGSYIRSERCISRGEVHLFMDG